MDAWQCWVSSSGSGQNFLPVKASSLKSVSADTTPTKHRFGVSRELMQISSLFFGLLALRPSKNYETHLKDLR